MGKNVVVQFVERVNACGVYRDLTVGNEYHAYLPMEGELDKDGLPVLYWDEMWISADDVGDEVVGCLCDGFVVVA